MRVATIGFAFLVLVLTARKADAFFDDFEAYQAAGSSIDGFNLDPAVHIPLPSELKTVQSTLGKLGMSGMMDDLEQRLNRAAEVAAPKAQALFLDAIDDMTLEDVKRIYKGPDDAATRYFQDKMTPPLSERMQPVVDRSLADVGAIQSYDNMMKEYKSVPFVPDAKADL